MKSRLWVLQAAFNVACVGVSILAYRKLKLMEKVVGNHGHLIDEIRYDLGELDEDDGGGGLVGYEDSNDNKDVFDTFDDLEESGGPANTSEDGNDGKEEE